MGRHGAPARAATPEWAPPLNHHRDASSPTWFPRERWVTGRRPGLGAQVGRSLGLGHRELENEFHWLPAASPRFWPSLPQVQRGLVFLPYRLWGGGHAEQPHIQHWGLSLRDEPHPGVRPTPEGHPWGTAHSSLPHTPFQQGLSCSQRYSHRRLCFLRVMGDSLPGSPVM